MIERGETPFIVGDGTNLVDFVYVANIASAHLLAVRNLLSSGTAAGRAFFISNDEPVAFRDLCLAIWREFDHVPSFQIKIPKGLAWWLGWGAEWVTWMTGTQGTFSRGAIMDATATRYVNIANAQRILGYVPQVNLPDGVRTSCQVCRSSDMKLHRTDPGYSTLKKSLKLSHMTDPKHFDEYNTISIRGTIQYFEVDQSLVHTYLVDRMTPEGQRARSHGSLNSDETVYYGLARALFWHIPSPSFAGLAIDAYQWLIVLV